jgi:hypothetical protein
MTENWSEIEHFSKYSVSDLGRVRSNKSERILRLNQNQNGTVYVGLLRDGIQYHRSVPLLVAKAFLAVLSPIFDTPINRDGDRANNAAMNLLWRPRWFAIKYHQQFRYPYLYRIDLPLQDMKTGEISENSFECSKTYGILESDIIQSIFNRTFVWPTYQEFRIIED